MQPSKKTFQREGKWIENPAKTHISLCVCGAKYIRTREYQKSCIKCFVKKID